MNTKPRPTSTSPIAIFIGVLGSRFRRPSQVHSAAKNGAAITRTTGLIDWNQPAGTRKLPTFRLVWSWAKKFIDVDACSNAIQKTIVNANRTSSAVSRSRSSGVTGAWDRCAAFVARSGAPPMPARYFGLSAR